MTGLGAAPLVDRWRPTRAGLVNVWRFGDETFCFHKGRLLLRGPNGTGKSMALELLFPFLLDANASPFRLTSGVKERGSLYTRVMTGTETPTRVGFAWGEFRRGDEVFTLGVRLRASASTLRAETDWFTTRREIGTDLALLDADRIPLARAALEAAVGDGGRVHESATEYREAVRRALFQGFSPGQYDALVTALLSLRREKISQDLSPAKLSEVLTASLPALDEKDVTEIAEGYERLDRRRDELVRLESDLAQVRDLARRQREYARRIVLSAANAVRNAESERDKVTRSEREARAELETAGQRRERSIADARDAAGRSADLVAEIETLRSLDAYREGVQLEELQRQREQLTRALTSAEKDAVARQETLDAEVARFEDAAQKLAGRRDEANRAAIDLRVPAEALGVAQLVADAAGQDDPDAAETLLGAWASSRRGQLAEVKDALAALEDRVRARTHWDQAVEFERARLEGRADALASAEAAAGEAADAYRSAVRTWVAGCELLDRVQLEAAIPAPPDDPAAVTAAIAGVSADALAVVAGDRARREAAMEDLRAESAALVEERAELAAGRTPEPEPPAWRSGRDRPGAPLWRLVDFASHCSPAERDGIEAGLLASGLLDAWVSPDGTVTLSDGVADALLDAAPASPSAGANLLEVLVILSDSVVLPEVVVDLLGRVGLVDSVLAGRGLAPQGDAGSGLAPQGDAGPGLAPQGDAGPGLAPQGDAGVARVGVAAVGRDGTFRLGPLAGRGPAQPARFIGAAAQERERARRIGELDAEIADLAARMRSLTAELEGLDRRRRGILAEVASAPDGAALVEAWRDAERARLLFEEAESRLRAAEARRGEAEQAVRAAQTRLMHLATRHSLPTDGPAIAVFEQHLGAFETAAGLWSRRRRAAAHAGEVLAGRESDRRRAAAELDGARDRLARAVAEHRAVVVRLETLESSVGSAYRDVVARIDAARSERLELEARQRDLTEERSELERRIGGLEQRVEKAALDRAEAEVVRDKAHGKFAAAVADGYGEDAEADLGFDGIDTATGILDAARAVAARFPTINADEASLSRSQGLVQEGYYTASQTLRGRIDLSFEQAETGFWLLRAATEGIRSRVAQLVRRMSDHLAIAAEELTEEERRLFDETLTGSLRTAVADRIRQANGLIDEINRVLASVRTDAAGVAVRLRWDVDPDQPHASRSVRALLLKDAAAYTDSERDALYEFFRGRLDQVRAELEGSSGWEERLREVLDYRRWHRFSLEVAHQDWEGFEPATAGRLQRLSTGERSIALHLPMLASITAHYDGSAAQGMAGCPRLILLDELFVGVDQSNRAQLFGLFVDWDLDAIFTSDQEWCAYSTLDGIAIHHLHSDGAGGPTVSSRFVWNGRRRIAAPVGAGSVPS